MHGRGPERPSCEHRPQPAGGERIGECVFWLQHDAGAGDRGVAQRVALVGGEPSSDRHDAILTAGTDQVPTIMMPPVTEDEAGMLDQFPRMLRGTASCKIFRCSGEDPTVGLQRAGDQALVAHVADHDAQLVTLTHALFGAVIERQVDRDLWVRCQIGHERGRERATAEANRRDQPQCTARLLLQLVCARLGQRHACQRGTAAFEVELSDLGQLVAACSAMEKTCAKPILNCADLLRDHRGRDTASGCGRRETAAIDHVQEHLHAGKLVQDSEPPGWECPRFSHVYPVCDGAETSVSLGTSPSPTEEIDMPILRLEMHPGRTPEQKREFVREATRVTVEILKCPPESVDIVIVEVPREAWAKAGKLLADG